MTTTQTAGATTYQIDKVHSHVSFQVRHLLTKVRGQFSDFAGTIQFDRDHLSESSVDVAIPAASIDTGTADRDAHLRSADFFDVEKFPAITFKSVSVSPMNGNAFAVNGDLTIHGVTRRVTLPVHYLGEAADPWGNTKAAFDAELTIDRKDYGLHWNAALETGGFLVGDDVKIELSIQAVKN